tara:strand:+ start:3526 stop:4422 length:897 start_codon:yes stop_codon:yes gene_type:complete
MGDVQTIGFIGLGAMGQAMTGNLLAGGFRVQGYDVSPQALRNLEVSGGVAVDSPGAAGEGAQVVIVMVPDVPEVEAAFNGEGGLLKSPGDGRIVMVMCTIDPNAVLRFADTAEAAGWHYVDCPVGKPADAARRKESVFMLSGRPEDKKTVEPVLVAMGEGIIDCGPVGHAAVIKVVNNYMSGIGALVVAEGLRMAEAGGVPTDKFLEVINDTFAGNGHSRMWFPSKALVGDIEPGFAIRHNLKDLDIARGYMIRAGLPDFIASGAVDAYRQAAENGYADKDFSAIYNHIGDVRNEPVD